MRGATLVAVAGVRCENQKTLKGEADLLLVDPDGVVQVRQKWPCHAVSCHANTLSGRAWQPMHSGMGTPAFMHAPSHRFWASARSICS